MATNDLQKKRDKAKTLRQKIRDERAAREHLSHEATQAQQAELVDLEVARLEAELEAEKALTAATKSANKANVGLAKESVVEAKNQASSTQVVAQQVADGTKQQKEN